MNEIYWIIILVLLLIILSKDNTILPKLYKENFTTQSQYNIQNYNNYYLSDSNSLESIIPYTLSLNNINAITFYIDSNNTLKDYGNNNVRYYSNNLVKNFGYLIFVKLIKNNHYLYYKDNENNIFYIKTTNDINYINDNPFTTDLSNADDNCIFRFILASKI
jgi:hypothetical protein